VVDAAGLDPQRPKQDRNLLPKLGVTASLPTNATAREVYESLSSVGDEICV
jgi:hypothetical protein